MKSEKGTKRINIIDIVIIVVMILGLAGVGLRFFVIKSTPDAGTLPDVESKKYLVSYVARDHRSSVVNYLADDKEFRFYESNVVFGKCHGIPERADAEHKYTTSDGQHVTVKNLAEVSEDGKDISYLKRWDISGKMVVEGKLSQDDGYLIINEAEKTTVALNTPVFLRSDDMIFTITITEIIPFE